MAKKSHKESDSDCFCESSPSELNYEKGCEVSAALHHGSYIRFGCLQFVFSILTYGDEDEVKEEPLEATETTESKTEEKVIEEPKIETDNETKD